MSLDSYKTSVGEPARKSRWQEIGAVVDCMPSVSAPSARASIRTVEGGIV